ncbi:Acetamidase/Formamidase [Cryphonectria parasitica EP155]|uniref:Acetamidase/Formamidase n=1 Tax=Cryphonectria parasitica (strain ATCC 38755 / EP155) TaxID=660469 RepID=A0A9P4Y6L6_CRYP1|nr:Acetamidase/Formamidase [Cryphonectria parasitica EP155]KAF3767441.1 Acetamidase/Formamidase [Cryphonectria parasitica EP155]
MAHSFHISPSEGHFKWSNAISPALTVPSGSEITFDLHDGGNNQIRPDNETTALADFDLAQVDPAFGPVFIEGAEPGDILKVEINALDTADYGWTAIFSGFGLLADEFPEQHVRVWDLREASLRPSITSAAAGGANSGPRRAVFKPGISVPVRPFLGVIGIAPAGPDELSTIPPYALSGGNIDTRYLGVGTTVYLPIQVPGALFSCGDGHAAQGDGEVCGTAIETPMRARLRLSVVKKDGGEGWMELKCPHYITPPRSGEIAEDDLRGTYAALGIHSDPREAARMALRGLIDWLEKEKGLAREEGYMLASVAASLRMTEVVDMPNFAVSCSIPLSTFDDDE